MRWRKRLGPVQIAGHLDVPVSTVHAVLTRCRINRLSYIDRVTGEPIRRSSMLWCICDTADALAEDVDEASGATEGAVLPS